MKFIVILRLEYSQNDDLIKFNGNFFFRIPEILTVKNREHHSIDV